MANQEAQDTRKLSYFNSVINDISTVGTFLFQLEKKINSQKNQRSEFKFTLESGEEIIIGRKELDELEKTYKARLVQVKDIHKFSKKTGKKSEPSDFKNGFAPVYLGSNIRDFVKELSKDKRFAFLKELEMLKQGFALRNTINNLLYAYPKITGIAKGQFCEPDALMEKHFGGDSISNIITIEDPTTEKSKRLHSDFLPEEDRKSTLSIIKDNAKLKKKDDEDFEFRFRLFNVRGLSSHNVFSADDLALNIEKAFMEAKQADSDEDRKYWEALEKELKAAMVKIKDQDTRNLMLAECKKIEEFKKI